MTGQQLKNSILQWAIQGKLVPQDSTDEPASELLERIRTEKAQLIKEGKLKKGQPTSHIYRDDEGSYYEKVGTKDPVCINHEIPFDLPSGWEWCRLSDIGITMTGKTPPRGCPEFFGDYIPFLGPANISDDKIISLTQGLSKKGMEVANVVPPFTVMQVCIGGSIGKCAIAYEEVTFNQQINSITPVICDVGYVYLGMMSDFFRRQMVVKSTGTATPIINRSNWETILFPLPPLEEQKRIVARIEELMPLVEQYDKAHSELTRLNDQLPEQLKKSILQEAIQGKLVPQDPTAEPASELLEKSGINLSKRSISTDNSDLPRGWVFATVRELFQLEMGQSPDGNSINTIKGFEFHQGKVFFGNKYLLPSSYFTSSPKKMGVPHSIILSVRAPVGDVNILDREICIGRGLCCLLPTSVIDLKFAYYSFLVKKPSFESNATGSTFKSISKRIISEEILPLPPLEEQKRIVARIEELMPRIDKLR